MLFISSRPQCVKWAITTKSDCSHIPLAAMVVYLDLSNVKDVQYPYMSTTVSCMSLTGVTFMPLDLYHITRISHQQGNDIKNIFKGSRMAITYWNATKRTSLIARFMGPTWCPPGSCRPQMGPILVPCTLLSGIHTTWTNLQHIYKKLSIPFGNLDTSPDVLDDYLCGFRMNIYKNDYSDEPVDCQHLRSIIISI